MSTYVSDATNTSTTKYSKFLGGVLADIRAVTIHKELRIDSPGAHFQSVIHFMRKLYCIVGKVYHYTFSSYCRRCVKHMADFCLASIIL